jgi:hypothetical protein
MRIDTAIKRLRERYEKTKNNPSIRKPVARALYETWKWADAYEPERKPKKEKGNSK